jgi:hypothetical protein
MAIPHRSSVYRVAAVIAAAVVASPTAQAFTIDDGASQYQIPKFDLEEQSRNFRTSPDVSTPGQNQIDTPLGKLQFNVQRGDPLFGSDAAARDRRHYNRMFAPDFLKDQY